MVAISLYRGNLHKVPDKPRRWVVPTPKISPKDFKNLVRRRSQALSRLSSATTTTTSCLNPNPNSNKSVVKIEVIGSDVKTPVPKVQKELPDEKVGEAENEKKSGGGNCDEKLVGEADALVCPKHEDVEENGVNASAKDDHAVLQVAEEEGEEKAEEAGGAGANPSSEMDNKENVVSDKEKRRREIEEKLKILKEKKHGLVQVLKQILSAEEELKRRSTIQGMSIRAPVALQVDTTHDPGSVSRLNTPRLGSDGNVSNEVEGGEADDVNHNVHSSHLLRTSSTSPSPDSQQRKSAFNTVPLPARANSGVANSPSRFALNGQQGRPSVSLSGTNYVASSPSPAASGATSAFRDGRVPSPWN